MRTPSRRRFLAGASAASLAALGGCLGGLTTEPRRHPVSGTVTSWPSFRGDRYNTGFARGVAPTSTDPSVRWSADVSGPVWGSPVVVDGTVYIGSAGGSVYAFDAETGDRQWSFATDHRVEGSPAVADGTVYVGSYDRHLYAIDAESGESRWDRDLGGLIRGSPTVQSDSVLLGVGCHNLACAWYADEADVSENGWVYSLDAETGETNWEYAVGDEVVSTPAVADGTAYVGASDERLYALDADAGTVEWTYEVSDLVWSSPAVAFGTVFFGDWDGLVHAVDADSGDAEWTADTHGNYISGSVAVDEEAVYVGDTPLNTMDDPTTYYGEVFRFDRTDGTEDWRFETDALEVGSSPVVADETLYVGTHSQTEDDEDDDVGVYAISTDGDEEWFFPVDGRGVGSSPALVDGTLYFGGTDGRVYAVE